MTTPFDDTEGEARRLHPLSWLFAALQQLKSFALPLVVLAVTGRGNRFELVGLVGVAALAIAALVQYWTYRYRLTATGIAITSGLLQRTRRDIPYDRVHNVVLHQSVLHRLCGVAEVRLESAGGAKAEGHMRVLSLADAQALERLVRERRSVAEEGRNVENTATAAPATPLLRLPPGEVVKLGLISNRGMVVVAAALGTLWQALPNGAEPVDIARDLSQVIVAEAPNFPAWLTGPAGVAATAAALVLVAFVALRVLSVILALLMFFGFTLSEDGRQLRVERGLLTRIRLHVPRGRIQAWRIRETMLHRWFERRSLRVDTAGGTDAGSTRGMRDLVPIAPVATLDALVTRWLPSMSWPPGDWHRLHPKAWRRLVTVPSLLVIAVTTLLVVERGLAGLAGAALLPVVILRARVWARHAAYVEVPGGVIAVREGWLTKSWRFAEIRKLQSLRLTQSPFDRRHDMATLWVDTAGAAARDGYFRIRFLPAAEARALHDRLAAQLDL